MDNSLILRQEFAKNAVKSQTLLHKDLDFASVKKDFFSTLDRENVLILE
jgi:hypothetical protein